MKAFRLSGRVLAARVSSAAARHSSARVPAPARGGAGEHRPSGFGAESTASAPPAVSPAAVPWRVAQRSASGVLEIEHRGTEPLRAVRVSLAGGGLLGVSLPRTVHPGERVRVVLRGVHADGALAAPDALLVLRWFQADGTELLWPIAL